MAFAGLALFLAAAAPAIVLASLTAAEVSFMGRHLIVNTSVGRRPAFDFQGFTIGVPFLKGSDLVGLSRVDASFMVETSDSPMNQPHRFRAALFHHDTEYFKDGRKRSPPFTKALYLHNFTSANWSDAPTINTEVILPTSEIKGINAHHNYSLFIVKLTEPNWNQPHFNENFVTFLDFKMVPPSSILESAEASTLPIAVWPDNDSRANKQPRRIEFFGDSLTCGYCNLCLSPNTFYSEDYSKTWSYRAAEWLGADFHTAAWSGYGVARNCCGGNVTMPYIINRTLATVNKEDWRFSQWRPDVVMVLLGANDHLNDTHVGPFEKEFVRDYMQMIGGLVRSYAINGAPKLQVILGCGPIPFQANCPYIEQIAKTDAPAEFGSDASFHFLSFDGVLSNQDRCCWHPDVTGDALLAGLFMTKITEVMGW